MSAYPILKILFFIAAFFAPKDASVITLAGPEHTTHWTWTANGWSQEKKLWSIKNYSVVIDESGQPKDVVDVATFVKAAITHDWTKEKKLMLNRMQSLEKTDDGFIFRENIGDSSERVYRITYGKKG
ncbi:MAG TPA: hypothetical protein VFB27_12520 [Opitutaceae bacterium]|nr:hypothetical protein [Opitutaceae bacterium]